MGRIVKLHDRRWGRSATPFAARATNGALWLLIAVAALWLGGGRVVLRLPDIGGAAPDEVAATAFPLCGGGRHVTCVIDGDTFYLRGQSIASPTSTHRKRIRHAARKRRDSGPRRPAASANC